MSYKKITSPTLITVFDITQEVHSSMDAEKCAEIILDRTSKMLGTELGSVMLVDNEKRDLFIKKAKGLDEKIAKATRVKIGDGISGWVAREGEPLLVKDLSQNRRFKKYKKKGARRYTTDSLLSVPLKIGGKTIGVVNVNNKRTKKVFTRKDLSLLSFIAEHVALAIQNALIYEATKNLADLKLDFVSDISHELKNPLAIIRESISLISDSFAGVKDRRKKDILKIAIRNIDRLNRILGSLLELAKLEAGKAPAQRTYLDIRKIVDESVDFIIPSAKKKGIDIKKSFLLKYSKIWADGDKITQVMNNLLSNALKFTPKKGNIKVAVKEKGKDVLISVQDTGIGIKKSDLPKLFSRFERIRSKGGETEGTGLGLAICKEIVDLHRGKIWATSRLNKGSEFTLSMPRDLRAGRKA